jgi:two-component system, LytTR family, response regulator
MIRSIIVDDEKPAREVIKNYLAEFCPDVEVIATADSVVTARKAILLHHPDLVFLDIDMPDGNGFDLLRRLHRIDFRIIFVTAFSEYAVRAFRFFATDYLLKPVNIEELMEAVEKVRNDMDDRAGNSNIEELIKFTQHADPQHSAITIPDKKGFKVVGIHEIIHCEADGYCTHFYITGGKKITSSRNLKFYEEILEEKCFLRVHHSYLVNLKHVKDFAAEGVIHLSEDHSVPLGNTYRKRFLDRFTGSR